MLAMPAPLARGRCDDADRLIEADGPLASLQRKCGGELPGVVAIPGLLELIRKARHMEMRLSRQMAAQDEDHRILAWIVVLPDADGCTIEVQDWQTAPLVEADTLVSATRQKAIEQAASDGYVRLDREQRVRAVAMNDPALAPLAQAMEAGLGEFWTNFVTLEDFGHHVPLHWRLMNGALVRFAGSDHPWRVQLVPVVGSGGVTTGYDLYLALADAPMLEDQPASSTKHAPSPPDADPVASPVSGKGGSSAMVGRQLAPMLRQPIGRIIANAETIKSRLSGPLRSEYAGYAGDIAEAARHLLDLVQDLTDLEAIESPGFHPSPDAIDLADVGRRAAGILQMRASERGITLDAPQSGEKLPAVGEFRRVLQILLNLLTNAIRYSPNGSQVWLRLAAEDGFATIIVADQGQGLDEDQQARIFEKFERLGRQGDGGSGLGLYIARRLARAMDGDLTVESAPGKGARFILRLPAGVAQ